MPKLPSGRQIGIDGTDVKKLLEEIKADPASGINQRNYSWADVMRFVRIVKFVPPEEAESQRRRDFPLDARSIPGSKGLVAVDTGYTLAEVKDAAANWSEEDRSAFVDFLCELRTESYLGALVSAVRTATEKAANRGNGGSDQGQPKPSAKGRGSMRRDPWPGETFFGGGSGIATPVFLPQRPRGRPKAPIPSDIPTMTEEQIQIELQRMRDQGYGTVEISFAEAAMRGLDGKPQGNA